MHLPHKDMGTYAHTPFVKKDRRTCDDERVGWGVLVNSAQFARNIRTQYGNATAQEPEKRYPALGTSENKHL